MDSSNCFVKVAFVSCAPIANTADTRMTPRAFAFAAAVAISVEPMHMLTTTAAMTAPIHTEHIRLVAALILVPRWLLGDDITDTTRYSVADTHDWGYVIGLQQ